VSSTDVIRAGVLDPTELQSLQAWATEIEAWPAGSHRFGHYAEATPNGPAICRTENVSACHDGVAALVQGVLERCASDALGTPVVAFKDKLNYKQPGGAGFRPHQDALAYPGAQRVMSILLALDECDLDSGCLFLADGVTDVLPVDDRGVVRDDVCASLDWYAAELHAGDAVCIEGFAPHYSEANRTDRPRRVLVASYSPVSDGYTREQYYAARADTMTKASAGDGRFRISTLADFAGTEVPTTAVNGQRCTHS
jgi:hypothetical protein